MRLRHPPLIRIARLLLGLLCCACVGLRADTVTVDLLPGVNVVCIPTVPANDNVPDLFSDMAGKLTRIDAFDPVSGQWLFYAPQLPAANTLTELPGGTGFLVEVTAACTLTVVGVAPAATAPSDIFPAALKCGWNLTGVRQATTVRKFAAARTAAKLFDFVLAADRVYRYAVAADGSRSSVLLAADDALQPGQGYWIDTDPDGDGVSSAAETLNPDGSAKAAADSTDPNLPDNTTPTPTSGDSGATVPAATGTSSPSTDTFDFGPFHIALNQISNDSNGIPVGATGTLTWPTALQGLIQPATAALPVEILYYHAQPQSAYCAKPGNLTLAGSIPVAGADVAYLSITSGGHLFVGCKIAASGDMPTCGGVIKWTNVSDKELDTLTQVDLNAGPFKGLDWVQFCMTLSDETSVSRFWSRPTPAAGATAKAAAAYQSNGSTWFLRMPALAAGVFDIWQGNTQVSTAKCQFNNWLPVTYAPAAGQPGFSGTGQVKFMQALVPGGIAAFASAAGASITADSQGRLAVTDNNTTYRYENATLDIFSADPGNPLHVAFRGFKATPTFTIGDPQAEFTNSAVWSPALLVFLEYEDDNLTAKGGCEIDADVVMRLTDRGNSGGLTQQLGGLVSALKNSISKNSANTPTPNLAALFAGSSVHLKPSVEIIYKQGANASQDFSLDFHADADFGVAVRGGTPANYGLEQTFATSLTLNNIPYIGGIGFRISREASWFSDKIVGGTEDSFEDTIILRGGVTLDTSMMGTDNWKLTLGGDWRTAITYAGPAGSYTPPGAGAPVDAKHYKVEQVITAELMAEATNQSLDGDGWQFGVESLRFEFDPADCNGNSFKDVIVDYGRNFGNSFKILRRVVGDATLVPPAELNWLPALDATVVWERLNPDAAAPADAPPPYRLAFIADVNLPLTVGEFTFRIRNLIYAYDSKENSRLVMGTCDFEFDGNTINATMLIEKKDGKWTLLVDTGGIPLGGHVTITNGLLSFTYDPAAADGQRFSAVTADLSVRVQDPALTEMGYPDGFMAEGTYSDGDYILQLQNIPLTLQNQMPDCGVQFEKFRNITLTKYKDGRYQFQLSVDVVFSSFVDDQSSDRATWPRATFTCAITLLPQAPGENKAWKDRIGFELLCQNIGPINCGDGANLTLNTVGLGRTAEGIYSFKGGVTLTTPTSWRTGAFSKDVVQVPDTILGDFELGKTAGHTMFKAAFAWNPAPVIKLGGGSTQINCKQFIYTKGSPWAFGINTDLTFAGQTVSGTVTAGNGGFSLILPPDYTFDLDVADFHLAVKNLSVQFGKPNCALAGNVTLTIPVHTPLNRIFTPGDDKATVFQATLAGSPDDFKVSAVLNLTSSIDFGQLGTGALTIYNLSVDTKGAFAADGKITLNDKTVDFTIGYQSGNFSFMADFGDAGVNLELANIFDLNIKNKLGIATTFGMQYVEVDDLALSLGGKVAGADLSVKRLIYFLPSSVPPVGFPFFDDLDGNLHIVGFAVNVGLQFPFPNENDCKLVFDTLAKGIGGSFDPSPLRALSAPSIGLHDVYVAFPQLPGYTFKDNSFQSTNNIFGDIFGTNQLTLINKLALKPAQIYDLASAKSPFEFSMAIIPAGMRHGSVSLNLRGFAAAGSFNLVETDLSQYTPLVPNMPALATYVSKVRYVDDHTPDFPAVLQVNQGATLLNSWGPSDTGMTHDIGVVAQGPTVDTKIRNFLVTVAGAPEVVTRNLSNAQYADALVKAILERPSATAQLANYAAGGQWIVNPFDSRCRVTYPPQSITTQDEAAKLASLLNQGLSRGAALDYLLAYDDFRTREQPLLMAATSSRQQQFVSHALEALTGTVPADPAVATAWTKTLQPSAIWTADATATGGLVATPAMPLPPGFYRAAFDVKAAANSADTDVLVFDLLVGGAVKASQHFRGKDFAFADSWQLVYLPFTLTTDGSIALRVVAAGGTTVSIKGLTLFSAVQAENDTLPLPDNLGGGQAQVRWDVLDMSAEVQRVQDLVTFLQVPDGKTWEQYLPDLWQRLSQLGGVPAFQANEAVFDYSAQVQVELDFNETADGYRPSTLKIDNQQLMARYGSVTLYDVPSTNPEDGWLVTDDTTNLGAVPFGDNRLSTVTVSDGGRAVIYRDPAFQGPLTEATADIPNMADTDVGDNQASSVQVWFPVDLTEVADWRFTARTTGGTIVTMDAGGIEILFPGDPQNLRVLAMLPNSRLAQGYASLLALPRTLTPDKLLGDPQTYLATSWAADLMPVKATARSSGCTLDFTAAAGLTHRFELYQDTTGQVTGVAFEPATQTLYAQHGSAKLYPNANYQGTEFPVMQDIADLNGTPFGRVPPRSAKLDEGGSLTFYPAPHFGDFVGVRTWQAGTSADLHTPLGEAVPDGGWGINYVKPLDTAGSRGLTKGPGAQLDAGYYKLSVEIRRDPPQNPGTDANGNAVLAQFQPAPLGLVSYDENAGQPLLAIGIKAVAPYKADLAAHTVSRADIEPSQWQSVDLTFELQEPTTVDILVDVLADRVPCAIRNYSLSKVQPGLNPETLTASVSALPDKPRGSVRAMKAVQLQDTRSWVLSRIYPSGLTLSLAHGNLQQAAAGSTAGTLDTSTDAAGTDTRLTCTLLHSDNQILLKKNKDGSAFMLEPRAPSGYVYPPANYYVYAGATPSSVTNLQTEAAAFRHYIRKTITTPPDAAGAAVTATVTPQGGITATCNGVAVAAENAASKYSGLALVSDHGHQLRLQLSPGHDFTAATITSVNPEQTVPTYNNAARLPVGISIPIPDSAKGGLYVNASLTADAKSVVQLKVSVAGAIQEDGNFYLKGNGDLVINDFTISSAEIDIGSKEGLYVKGTINLFNIANTQVEGYIQPDGKFLLRGTAAIMKDGTGVSGAFNFDNTQFAIFGGIYIANHLIKTEQLVIANGKASFHEDISIGYAGFDYTVSIYFQAPYGANVNGDAFLDVTLPIKIYGPTDYTTIKIWLPFHTRHVKIPTSWGWITIGHIRAHFDLDVDMKVTGDSVGFGLGPCTLNYNFPRRDLSVSW